MCSSKSNGGRVRRKDDSLLHLLSSLYIDRWPIAITHIIGSIDAIGKQYCMLVFAIGFRVVTSCSLIDSLHLTLSRDGLINMLHDPQFR